MAIDTVVKRASALAVTIKQLPLPDSTIDQGDRQTLLSQYSGILSGAAIIIIGSIYGAIVKPIWQPISKNIIDRMDE